MNDLLQKSLRTNRMLIFESTQNKKENPMEKCPFEKIEINRR